jgi:glycosyltransferase involved in cell wall biosynthesis
MRIAVVNNFFPPRVGGSAHLSDALAQGYAAAGHEVLVLTASYKDAPTEEFRGGCRVLRLPSWTMPQTPLSVSFDIGFALRPSLLRNVTGLLDEFRPDVIHQHGQFFDLTWTSGLYARKRMIPTLLSVHTRLESPRRLYQTAFRAADTMLVAPILKTYKPQFVVMDVQMEDYIRARYGHAANGLEYIPVGVDPQWLLGGNAEKIRIRHDLGERPIILSLGHVIPLRDRVKLVQALPRVLQEVPDLAVIVAGDVYYDEFLRVAEQLGVRGAIVTTGAVPKSEIPDYLAAATLETHDLDGFGLGTASLEAMGAGCPVVAAIRPDNFPGIELYDRKHLYLTPVGDTSALAETILEVLRDPIKAKQVGVGGQELIHDRFTLRSVIDAHLEALKRLAT